MASEQKKHAKAKSTKSAGADAQSKHSKGAAAADAHAKHAKHAATDEPLVKHEAMFGAVESFVRENCNFQASVPINMALDDLGKCTTAAEAFVIPLSRQLFTMEAALLWLAFLTVAPARAVAEGDAPFSASAPLAVEAALKQITDVYDVGVQTGILEHFEADDDEDEGDEEDDEEDEADK